MIDAEAESRIARLLAPECLVRGKGEFSVSDTEKYFDFMVRQIKAELPDTVLIEIERRRGVGSHNEFSGLVVFDGKNTTVLPVEITTRVVRLHDEPFYVGHETGAALLLRAVIEEVEAALAAT